jgi:methionyl-tRNA formyltransferase
VGQHAGELTMEHQRCGRVVFIGAVHEAKAALSTLLHGPAQVVMLVTLAEPQAYQTAGFVELGPLAALHGMPILRTSDVNDPECVATIAAARPDLIVCVGWTRLLKDELLAVPRHGCVGFHASLLPKDRGRAPVNWAIIRGQRIIGNTMMMLAPGADTGDIVDQEPVIIEFNDNCATVYEKVGLAGARMLRKHLPALLQGTAPRRAQPPSHDELLPKRTPEMGITDWDASPIEIYDWVRALTHPYPGAFTLLNGQRLWVWHADDPIERDVVAPPGTVLGADGAGLVVAVRGGTVELLVVQEEGCREETAARWFERRGLLPGVRFDTVDAGTIAWARGLGSSRFDPNVAVAAP